MGGKEVDEIQETAEHKTLGVESWQCCGEGPGSPQALVLGGVGHLSRKHKGELVPDAMKRCTASSS